MTAQRDGVRAAVIGMSSATEESVRGALAVVSGTDAQRPRSTGNCWTATATAPPRTAQDGCCWTASQGSARRPSLSTGPTGDRNASPTDRSTWTSTGSAPTGRWALNQALVGLGAAQDELPSSTHEPSALAGRRLLLVLDNALCPEQIRPLLPGPTGTTPVTSRNQLRGWWSGTAPGG